MLQTEYILEGPVIMWPALAANTLKFHLLSVKLNSYFCSTSIHSYPP